MKTMDYLTKMHEENRADHDAMTKRMDAGFVKLTEALVAHTREDDSRFSALQLDLQPLKEMRAERKWMTRTFIGGAVTVALDVLFHIIKGFK